MPTSIPQRAGRGTLTADILIRILRDLIDALSRDMHITQVRRTPAGLLFTVTSRTRPDRTCQVCRRQPTLARPHSAYSCNCEHGLQIEEFTPGNRHAHCWHVRFVHFLTLPAPARRQLLTRATGHAQIAGDQAVLRAVWHMYIERRRAELRQPADQRPSAPFVYRLAAGQQSGATRPR